MNTVHMQETIIIGSRGSDLALWQAHFLQKSLLEQGYRSEIKIIKTQGDKIQHISLEKLEGKGFFTKEIEDALLMGEIDVAVHSHKDLPTAITPGLTIAAVSHREDAAELLLIRNEKVDELNQFNLATNAIVGTSSSRRNVQMRFFRPDLQFADIRGNVPTRINKLRNRDYDAILLAFAGVHRLQLDISDLTAVKLPPYKLIPSPAQGVLAFQCREKDERMIGILDNINHPDVADTIYIERKVMNLFNGGCHMPLGVYCRKHNNQYQVWAAQTADRLLPLKRLYVEGNNADELATHIFKSLQQQQQQSIFISTDLNEDALYLQVLRDKGFEVIGKSCVHMEFIPFQFSDATDWVFFTSKNGVDYFFNSVKSISPKIKFAAIGEATAKQINQHGYAVDFVGEGTIMQIAEQFKLIAAGEEVVFAVAENRQTALQSHIAQFAQTSIIPVYSNTPIAIEPVQADIYVFTSPLNVDGFLLSNNIPSTAKIVAIGATTQQHLIDKGFMQVVVPPFHNLFSVSELICGW